MPPRKGANSERNLAKKAAKAAEEPAPSAPAGGPGEKLLARLQRLAQGCVLYVAAPKVLPVFLDLKSQVMDAAAKKKSDAPLFGSKEEAKTEDASAENAGDEKNVPPASADQLFEDLRERLVGANPLGVFPTGNETLLAFLHMLKEMRFDGGPRAKKKGSPALDRLATNFHDLMPLYLYLLLVLLALRSFLFRSFFACLPWLMVYQFVSVLLPTEKTDQIPLPLEKVPLSVRIAVTMLLHGLVWLFFVYEFVVKMYWFEWFLMAAGFAGAAYLFSPLDSREPCLFF